jgi:SAM-dependent methyltransferase
MGKKDSLDSCPLCQSSQFKKFLECRNIHGVRVISDELFFLHKCQRCSLVFLNPRPQDIFLYYPKDYFGRDLGLYAFFFKLYRRILYQSRKVQVENTARFLEKIIDIGAGEGKFLTMFKDSKIKKSAVEPQRSGFEILKRNLPEAKIWNSSLQDTEIPENFFDVATAWHVLEHFDDPEENLKKIYRILKPGGYFFVAVPNIDSLGFKIGRENWYYLDTPRHLFHFSPKTASRLLAKVGFKNIQVSYPYLDNPLSFVRTFQNKYKLGAIAYLILPLSLIGKFVATLIRKSETIMITAQK